MYGRIGMGGGSGDIAFAVFVLVCVGTCYFVSYIVNEYLGGDVR